MSSTKATANTEHTTTALTGNGSTFATGGGGAGGGSLGGLDGTGGGGGVAGGVGGGGGIAFASTQLGCAIPGCGHRGLSTSISAVTVPVSIWRQKKTSPNKPPSHPRSQTPAHCSSLVHASCASNKTYMAVGGE